MSPTGPYREPVHFTLANPSTTPAGSVPLCGRDLTVWDALISGHSDGVPELTLAAYRAGCLLGCVAATRAFINHATPALFIGPVAIAPEHRGTGIGSMLVMELLARARVRAERGVFALDYPEFYGPLGFRPASHWGLALAVAPPPPANTPSSTLGSRALVAVELQTGDLADQHGTVHISSLFTTA